MKSIPFLTVMYICILVLITTTFSLAMSCDSCGRECRAACGTRHFRTCCFNYLRKRSVGPETAENPPTRLKLELWFTKSQLEKLNKQSQLKRLQEHGYHEDSNDNQNEIFQNFYKPIKSPSPDISSKNNPPDNIEETSTSPNSEDESRLQFIYDS